MVPEKFPRAVAAAAVAVLDLGVAAGYQATINNQSGPPDHARTGFVAGFIVFLALLAVIGALTRRGLPKVSAVAFIASATGHLGLGILAIFSIGWPLIAGGALLLYLGITARGKTIAVEVAPVLMLITLGVGIALTG